MEAGLHSFLTYSLNEGKCFASRFGLFTTGKEPPVPIGYDCGCALDPIQEFWRKQKFALLKL